MSSDFNFYIIFTFYVTKIHQNWSNIKLKWRAITIGMKSESVFLIYLQVLLGGFLNENDFLSENQWKKICLFLPILDVDVMAR